MHCNMYVFCMAVSYLPFSSSLAHFFNCLIQCNDLGGLFCRPQIHRIAWRAVVTTRCLRWFWSLVTGAILKCKQFSCDLADEKVKIWGPHNGPPPFTENETLEGAIKERAWGHTPGAPKRFLRSGVDFTDITLVYKDADQHKAHKIILSWPVAYCWGNAQILTSDQCVEDQ